MVFAFAQIIFLSYMSVAKLVWKTHLLHYLSLLYLILYLKCFPTCSIAACGTEEEPISLCVSLNPWWCSGVGHLAYIFLHEISVMIQHYVTLLSIGLLVYLFIYIFRLAKVSASTVLS